MAKTTTLLQLRTKTRLDQVKIDRNGGLWNDGQVDEAVNIAISEVQKRMGFGWQFTEKTGTLNTEVNQERYDLPTDFVNFQLVRREKFPLVSTTLEEIRDSNYYLGDSSTGSPTRYYVFEEQLGLYPIPQAVQEIDFIYRAKVARLVNDSDIMQVPDEFVTAVTMYAAYVLFSQRAEDNFIPRARNMQKRYNEEMGRMVVLYGLPDAGQNYYKPARAGRNISTRRYGAYYRGA